MRPVGRPGGAVPGGAAPPFPPWVYWSYVGVFVVGVGATATSSWWPPRLRDKYAASLRVEYALRHHTDPGPELRERADGRAHDQHSVRWFPWWLLLAGPPVLLLSAPWSRPLVAVPAALLTIAGGLGWALAWRARARAAGRWIADPPGPPRTEPAIRQETGG